MSEAPTGEEGAGVGVTSVSEPLNEKEQQQLKDLLSNPLFFPTVFENWISQLVQSDVTRQLPFASILKSDQLVGAVNLFPDVSPAYLEFGTFKPIGQATITGPCKGMIFYACSSYNWSGDDGVLGLSVNDAAVDPDQTIWLRGAARRIFGGRAQYVDLPLAENTVRLMAMRWGSGDVDMQDVAMAVFRIFLV